MVVLYGFLFIVHLFVALWSGFYTFTIPLCAFFSSSFRKSSMHKGACIFFTTWLIHSIIFCFCVFWALPNLWELI
jgi:hypothetical protein